MRTSTSISFSVLGLSALWLMENSLAVTITGSVESNISVSCSYPETYENNSKYFCQMSGSFAPGDLQCVHTTQPETRSERGRVVLLDDTSAHVLTANISRLAPEDSGKYWCGVDIALLPDFTSEIWITVTKEHPQEQTTDLFVEEPGESYSRFMMMVTLMCVGALFSVCLFGLFQVLKHNSCSNSGLYQTQCREHTVTFQTYQKFKVKKRNFIDPQTQIIQTQNRLTTLMLFQHKQKIRSTQNWTGIDRVTCIRVSQLILFKSRSITLLIRRKTDHRILSQSES